MHLRTTRPHRRATRRPPGRAIVLLAALSFAAPSAAAPPPARPFRDAVGVNAKFSQGEPLADLPLLKQLGVRWVRDSVDWHDVEPVAGRYDPFPPAFRQRLDYYRANDVGLVFGLWYDNTVAYPNTPADPARSTDPAAYGRYAAEVTRRLRASGVRFVVELYNEPHNTLKWIGGAWNGAPPCPWLDRYVDMVRAAAAAARDVDPSVRLLVCDDMWVLHYRFLERGLPPGIDGLAVHPYVKNWPEISAVEQDTSWAKPFDVVAADGSLRSATAHLRDHAAAKLGHTPAIWLTEWGWPIGGPVTADARPMTEDLLAGLIPRAYLTAADAGVEAVCWFSLQDSVDGPMGLTRNDGVHRKPFEAFRVMTQTLGDCTSIAHVRGGDHPTTGVQAYRLAPPRGPPTLLVWDIDGNCDATLSAATAPRVADVFGRPVAVAKAADGRVTLHLGWSPLYVQGVGPDATVEPVSPAHVPPAYLFP